LNHQLNVQYCGLTINTIEEQIPTNFPHFLAYHLTNQDERFKPIYEAFRNSGSSTFVTFKDVLMRLVKRFNDTDSAEDVMNLARTLKCNLSEEFIHYLTRNATTLMEMLKDTHLDFSTG
jgi:hypothetical protein